MKPLGETINAWTIQPFSPIAHSPLNIFFEILYSSPTFAQANNEPPEQSVKSGQS